MEVEYSISLKDWEDFNLYHFHHSPSLRRLYYVTLTLGGFIGGALLFFLIFYFSKNLVESLIFTGIYALAFIFLVPQLYLRNLRKSIRKMLQEGENKGAIGRHRLTITPEGVIEKTDFNETKTAWSSVEKIAVTENGIYIYMSSIAAYIVPKRAFSSKEAFNEFVQTLKQYYERYSS
jgi:hypothetical protein